MILHVISNAAGPLCPSNQAAATAAAEALAAVPAAAGAGSASPFSTVSVLKHQFTATLTSVIIVKSSVWAWRRLSRSRRRSKLLSDTRRAGRCSAWRRHSLFKVQPVSRREFWLLAAIELTGTLSFPLNVMEMCVAEGKISQTRTILCLVQTAAIFTRFPAAVGLHTYFTLNEVMQLRILGIGVCFASARS